MRAIENIIYHWLVTHEKQVHRIERSVAHDRRETGQSGSKKYRLSGHRCLDYVISTTRYISFHRINRIDIVRLAKKKKEKKKNINFNR